MMFWLALIAPALAAPVDLDGDRTPDPIVVSQDEVRIGGAAVECFGNSECEVTVVDVRSSDRFKEVQLCNHGPRGERVCELMAYRAGRVIKLELHNTVNYGVVESLSVSGSGIVLTRSDLRLYRRLDKFVLARDGLSIEHVPQPFYTVDETVHVDRTFRITSEPGGGATVANVRPDSDITVLLESGTQRGKMLVRISSGLVGWVDFETLGEASDRLMMMMGAG